jgi:hypothetical protein
MINFPDDFTGTILSIKVEPGEHNLRNEKKGLNTG